MRSLSSRSTDIPVRPARGGPRRWARYGAAGLALALVQLMAVGLVTDSPALAATTWYAYAGGAASSPSSCPPSATAAGECTLAEALTLAGGGDTIYLASASPNDYIGNWAVEPSGTTSSAPLTIEPAPGVVNPTLDGNDGNASGCTTGTCDGAVLTIGDVYVHVDHITIQNADDTNTSVEDGGAIDNSLGGNLAVSGDTFSDDTALYSGGAIDNADEDGGIGATCNGTLDNQGAGTLVVSDSTFDDDLAFYMPQLGEGGAIANAENCGTGTVTISSSTFYDNSAAGFGGAIDNADTDGIGTLVVSDSTFYGNNSGRDGGAIDNADLYGIGTLTVVGSTFEDNTATYFGQTIDSGDNSVGGSETVSVAADIFDGTCDLVNGTWTDEGYNVGSDASCFSTPTQAATDDNAGSGLGSLLGALADNGGPTETIGLLGGNPAMGLIPDTPVSANMNGSSVMLCPTTDQREMTSASGAACDAGALQQFLTVTAPSPTIAYGSSVPTLTPTYSGFVNNDTSTSLTTPPTCTTTATASSPPGPYTVTCSGAVDANYDIGYVAGTLTVSGGGAPGTAPAPAPVPTLTVTAPSLTITEGSAIPALTPTYSGFTNGNTAVSLTAPAACATTATSSSIAGAYPVTCSGAVDSSYSIVYVAGVLTVATPSAPSPSPPPPAPPTPASRSAGSHLASMPSGTGWWVLEPGGVVKAFGTAKSYGSPSESEAKTAVAIAATPDGKGYWVVGTRGQVYTFGDAHPYGSPAALHLAKPIAGIASTPDGKGYWLVATDGGVFSYGDAHPFGSAASLHVSKPIVAISSTPDGKGYWLVALDGGVFSYGDAHPFGSAASLHLSTPIVGIASTPDGKGYWVIASNGDVLHFGDAHFYGSEAGKKPPARVAGLVIGPTGKSYAIVNTKGSSSEFPSA